MMLHLRLALVILQAIPRLKPCSAFCICSSSKLLLQAIKISLRVSVFYLIVTILKDKFLFTILPFSYSIDAVAQQYWQPTSTFCHGSRPR